MSKGSRSRFFLALFVVLGLVLSSCAPAATVTPEKIVETVEVPVKETVIVGVTPEPTPTPSFAGETLRAQYYPAADGEVITKWITQPFIQATGATVIDEHGWTGEGIAKLKAQKADPQLDVVIFDDVGVITAAREGLLQVVDLSQIPNAVHVSPRLFYGDGSGIGLFVTPVSIIYNKELVDPPPDSWEDLFDPKYEGKVAIEPPEWTGFLRVMLATAKIAGGDEYNMEPAWAKLAELKPNLHSYAENVAMTAELIKSGDILIVATAPYLYKEFIEQGYPIGVAAPKEGVTYIVGAIAMVKGHKAPEELIYAFMNQALSKETQAGMMKDIWWGPSNSEVEIPADLGPYILTVDQIAEAIPFNLDHLVAVREEWMSKGHEVLR